MLLEAVGGWLSGSLALLADAGHMLTDAGALGLTLFTAWIARRLASQTRTHGYLRWEILAALVNGAVLFGIAALVIVEAVSRLGRLPEIRGGLFLGVALAGLVANAVRSALLHGAHRDHLNTRGAYLHILGDLLGSAGAVLAAVVVLLTGWTPVDPLLSVLLSLGILVGAWRLVRESTEVLLESVPAHIDLAELKRRPRMVPGVVAVHDPHVWTVTSGMVTMSGHAVVPALADHPDALTVMQGELRAGNRSRDDPAGNRATLPRDGGGAGEPPGDREGSRPPPLARRVPGPPLLPPSTLSIYAARMGGAASDRPREGEGRTCRQLATSVTLPLSRTSITGKPHSSIRCCVRQGRSAPTSRWKNGSWTRTRWSGNVASRFSPRTRRCAGARPRSISSTRRATPISAARSSASCAWSMGS